MERTEKPDEGSATPGRGSSGGSGVSRGGAGLKRELRGMGYAEGEARLAPGSDPDLARCETLERLGNDKRRRGQPTSEAQVVAPLDQDGGTIMTPDDGGACRDLGAVRERTKEHLFALGDAMHGYQIRLAQAEITGWNTFIHDTGGDSRLTLTQADWGAVANATLNTVSASRPWIRSSSASD